MEIIEKGVSWSFVIKLDNSNFTNDQLDEMCFLNEYIIEVDESKEGLWICCDGKGGWDELDEITKEIVDDIVRYLKGIKVL